jgi:hypothetical protein
MHSTPSLNTRAVAIGSSHPRIASGFIGIQDSGRSGVRCWVTPPTTPNIATLHARLSGINTGAMAEFVNIGAFV